MPRFACHRSLGWSALRLVLQSFGQAPIARSNDCLVAVSVSTTDDAHWQRPLHRSPFSTTAQRQDDAHEVVRLQRVAEIAHAQPRLQLEPEPVRHTPKREVRADARHVREGGKLLAVQPLVVGRIGHCSAVLEADIADGDVELAARVALKVSKEVEDKVQACADELHSVNATLAQGVAALDHTQDALDAARQALILTQSALAAAEAGERKARVASVCGLADPSTRLVRRSPDD